MQKSTFQKLEDFIEGVDEKVDPSLGHDEGQADEDSVPDEDENRHQDNDIISSRSHGG